MKSTARFARLVWWQAAFLATSMSWLMAPLLNRTLSPRATLISQYETMGQPYAWLFRAGDVVAALLLLWFAWVKARAASDRKVWVALVVVATGMLLDPILVTECVVKNGVCSEPIRLPFLLHAAESVITAGAVVWLSVLMVLRRQGAGSYGFLAFQALYGLLFITGWSETWHLSTLTQYMYQCVLLVWLAWLCGKLVRSPQGAGVPAHPYVVRRLLALWGFANGVFAIAYSLADIRLLGHIHELYFAGNTAWIAQHGVVVGVAMLYISRHVWRGEVRARQILLVIMGLEVLRYALVTPQWFALGLYAATFIVLFVLPGYFGRGAAPLTIGTRVKDAGVFLAGLATAGGVAYVLLHRNHRVTLVTEHAVRHFDRYVWSGGMHARHAEVVLLAHTATAFITAGIVALLWLCFRPSRPLTHGSDTADVPSLLALYSTSSEDYFKLWPADKQYFMTRGGCIAYKIVGPIAFALADPLVPRAQHARAVKDFVAWTRHARLKACFLPVYSPRLDWYKGLKTIQIGATALVDVPQFATSTVRDKWWRWKQNRATKLGYTHHISNAPHAPELLQAVGAVSDAWLTHGGHQERGFVLGYYNQAYMEQCDLHYLRNEAGEVVAFVNILPCCVQGVATIDLLRYMPSAQDAMPYLLAQVTTYMQSTGIGTFDLGFVPFATAKGPLMRIAKTLSASQFSAQGLEQFKNKFDPTWQPVYIAYDGDMADLALVALNLEKAMRVQ